jgi:methylthioribose-1-phosphate isomerase
MHPCQLTRDTKIMSQHAVSAIVWRDDILHLLDQRCLPQQEIWLPCATVAAVIDAIKTMVVRGAPAIGIAAAYGVVLAARARYVAQGSHWQMGVQEDLTALAASRPTAVNLFWALDAMRAALAEIAPDQEPEPHLLARAMTIHQDDLAANHRMADFGATLMATQADVRRCVLTHCNTGALATGGHGTALGIIRTAWQRGLIDRVYADETRPWMQGARLTAWELMQENIPVVLNTDSAAAALMASGQIGWVIVGADRITANGDVANKIGTYGLAVLARYHGVRFWVAAPASTFDLAMASGADIPIEERPAVEITRIQGQAIAPQDVQAFNPVFDVTPAALIDAIITERGVIEQPDAAKIRRVIGG